MIESRNSEVNIEELKARIRASVARREAEGRASFATASAELFGLLSKEDFSLDKWLGESAATGQLPNDFRLQPVFEAQDAGYHINDLLKYHDHQFVWNAYLAMLKREADEEGLKRHLHALRSGRANKIDILARLRYSPEGKRADVNIEGLRFPALVRRAYRLPVLGYLLEWAVAISRLPLMVQAQRQTETYFAGQLDRIEDYLNRTSLAISAETRNRADLAESFRRSIAEVGTEQKRIAWLQHQQLLALAQNRQESNSVAFEGNGQSALAQDAQFNLDELYAAFENEFRPPAETREKLKAYLPMLDRAQIDSDVLDIGCGSGLWLELLREHGIRGRGVESNRTLTAEARARNLEVVEADAIRFLRTLPDSTLQAVTAFHFVEHLSLEQLVDFLTELRRTLKPGGLLIIETPNPKNLVVGACNFYSDPTHQRPLFPESLEFIFRHLGFENNRVQYLHPVDGSPFTARDAASQALHSWFFSARDYAIIANNSTA